MKILVCDDLKGRCEEAAKAVDDAHQHDVQVTLLFEDDLKSQLEILFDGVDSYLNGHTERQEQMRTVFDDADLIIMDNNLAHLGIQGSRLTAESIIGYVRAFSSAPYV